ncbi:MAG: glycosyltransferase family 2 protein, partial [Anaerolineales bacterium]
MFRPVRVIDIELSQPLTAIEGLERYETVKALVRLHGSPLGYVILPIHNGRCLATVMSQAVLDQLNWPILQHLLDDGLAAPPPSGLHIEDLVKAPHATFSGPFPLVTVAICTRDRAADLALCLEALTRLDYPALDLLVVDNAPTTEATEQLVRTRYPQARYVCEPRPGLDWARNRAILETRGEIIAYTDDDVVVDAGWVKAIAQVFVENPAVMAVTGLVAPYELETEAQILFEQYGGFGRGFQRREVTINPNDRERWRYYGTGQFGTGANMAYRRSVFAQLGLFDPALDVGTVTNGGGDLEMYFRVLAEGHTLVYE